MGEGGAGTGGRGSPGFGGNGGGDGSGLGIDARPTPALSRIPMLIISQCPRFDATKRGHPNVWFPLSLDTEVDDAFSGRNRSSRML